MDRWILKMEYWKQPGRKCSRKSPLPFPGEGCRASSAGVGHVTVVASFFAFGPHSVTESHIQPDEESTSAGRGRNVLLDACGTASRGGHNCIDQWCRTWALVFSFGGPPLKHTCGNLIQALVAASFGTIRGRRRMEGAHNALETDRSMPDLRGRILTRCHCVFVDRCRARSEASVPLHDGTLHPTRLRLAYAVVM